VLLPTWKRGSSTLVGSTTQNPFFAINSALVSEPRLSVRAALGQDVKTLVLRALGTGSAAWGYEVHLARRRPRVLAEVSDGDGPARAGAAEVGVLFERRSADRIHARAGRRVGPSQKRNTIRSGDAHYDAASALIKSTFAAATRAAIYWLARMLEGGEDGAFWHDGSCLASEDVGNADPQALRWRLPPCRLRVRDSGVPAHVAQAVTYLACAPKSNAATVATRSTAATCANRPAAGAHATERQPLCRREAAGPGQRYE